METFFIVLIGALLIIAIFDLVVGVSNDAVNFLTSAIGSHAATFRTIMIVASIGIFVGAASSGGLMEIAKRGIFNPQFFSFQDVVFIYVVVMLTDVLLLDFFNSMRIPTSTTISIVFELLGASMALSFLHVLELDQPVSVWMDYINTSKAISMISAIFMSVIIAFAVGWAVQYLVRGLLTFEYKRYGRIAGAIYGGLAIVIVVNFIVNVGFKHSPLKDSAAVVLMIENAITFYTAIFTATALLFYVLGANKNYDAFKTVTLIGTFALAMAFASNDLVNFIGVPVAGLEALGFWRTSGVPADQYMMNVWTGPAGAGTTMPIFLIFAGIVMVLTLWMSKKARNVVQTEIDLGRQEEGSERFDGNTISRATVRIVSYGATLVLKLTPLSIRNAIDRRYTQPRVALLAENLDNPPAFDMVRASTNLTIAAALISIGTYLKLPLSTSYVTFMLAMGTSLADRAWSQGSAVYRVSGVITVIGAWFFTAIAAITLSSGFAFIVGIYGFVGIGIVMVLVGTGLYVINNFINTDLKLAATLALPEELFGKSVAELKPYLRKKTAELAGAYLEGTNALLQAAIDDDRAKLRKLKTRIERQIEINTENKGALTRNIKHHTTRENVEAAKALLYYSGKETDLLNDLQKTVEIVLIHVLNLHGKLSTAQQHQLQDYLQNIQHFLTLVADEQVRVDDVHNQWATIDKQVGTLLSQQIEGNIDDLYSHKNNELVIGTIMNHANASRNLVEMLNISEGHFGVGK